MGRKSLFARRVKRRAVRKLQFEPLEARYALDGSLAQLVGDAFDLKQNGSQVALDVLANDTFDSEYTGARLITSVSYGSEGGRLEIAADRKSVLYTPPADFFGTETFVYAVDGAATAQVQVSLQSPLAADQFDVLPTDHQRVLDVLANDPFWAGYQGARRITSVSVGSDGGTITIGADGRSILYTPPEASSTAGYFRPYDYKPETFVYVVDDLYPAQVTVDVAVTVINDSFEMIQNTSYEIDLLANDPFWAGYPGERKITHLVGVSVGTSVVLSEDGRTIRYTPAVGKSGSDYFRYVVDGTYEASVHVRIYRPVIDDSFTVDQNSTDFFVNVTENDRYEDTAWQWRDIIDRVTAVTQSANGGTVTISEDGRGIVYTPAAGFAGSDTFTYTADGLHEATVWVSVTKPVRNDSLTAIQDTPNHEIDVLANDFIGNGYAGPKQITSVGATKNGGTLKIRADGKAVLYTPAAGYVGNDEFTYTVDGEFTATAKVFVQSLAQSDRYQFNPDPPHGPYTLNVLDNDLFGPGYAGPANITFAEVVEGIGTVTIVGGTKLRLDVESAGGYQIRYVVDGKYESVASVSIWNVLGGDAAIVDENSGPREIYVHGNDFRYNYYYSYNGPRQITSFTPSEHGGTVVLSSYGRFLYTPPLDFYGTDTFTYTVDDFMTATVTVNVVRRVRDDTFRVDASDGPQALPVMVNDPLGSNYSGVGKITSVTATAAGGTVTIAADGKKLVYTPAPGFVGTDTLTYKVDGAHTAEVSVVVDAAGDEQLPKFASTEAYAQFLIDGALERYAHLFGQQQWSYDFIRLADALFGSDSDGRSHSETNVQVAGVDEGDLVEFDSDFVYILSGDGELVIADAWPAEELSIASRFDVEGRPIVQFLHGDQLTIISEVGGGYDWGYWPGIDVDDSNGASDAIYVDGMWPQIPQRPASTIVTVLDVSDRTAPTIVQTTTLEGKYVDSRGVGDYVYVLVDNFNAIGSAPQVMDDDGDVNTPGRYETAEEYVARVTANIGEYVEQSLPNYSTYGADGELVRSGLLNSAEDIYQPLVADATNLVSIVSFNVESDEPGLTDTSAVYTTGAGTIYASLDNFYVFDRDRSTEDGAITRIVKFDWDPANGGVDFAATTTVAGTTVDQFSIDEHGEYLRIATTVDHRRVGNWSDRTENVLYVLQEDNGVFEFVGGLHNLALDETIRSVRFLGDRAFVTTFRTIDPLFAIDLSDPARPEAVGHITLPGFASYMQLIDENHLITVGQNTPDGSWGPTQVSLFDISNLAQPLRIAEYTFTRFSFSEAQADHHAFGYFAEHGLLAMPTSQTYFERVDTDGDGYRESRRSKTEFELAVFRVDALASDPTQRLVLTTEIAHETSVRRSGYIGDKLYSIANDSVKVVDVAAPNELIAELSIAREIVVPAITALNSSIVLWPGREPETTRFPAVPKSGAAAVAIEKAREQLSEHTGRAEGAPLLVSLEAAPDAPGGGYSLVFELDGVDHLVRVSDSGVVQLVEQEFEFSGAGAWHSVNLARVESPATVVGDFDLDGRVTNSDYARWVQSFGTVSLVTYHAADGNGDGVVNAADYTLWSANLGRIAADFDGDGAVGDGDYEFWKASFGATAGPGLAADGNGDGRVDAADFTVWRNAASVQVSPASALAVSLAFASEATEEESPRAEAVESRGSLPTTRKPQVVTGRVANPMLGFASQSQRASVSRTRQGFVLSERVATVREAGLLLALDRHLRDLADADEFASPLAFDQAMESLEAGCEDQLAAARIGKLEFASVR